MYKVSVFLRDRLVEVARRQFGSRSEAIIGRLKLMEEFKGLRMRFRATGVKCLEIGR